MRFIGSVIIAVIIVIIGLSIYLQPNDFSSCSVKNRPTGAKDCRQVDAVIAVSGGDTMARTKHAVMLYENGWARMIIFSGAAQDTSGPSNALVMRQSAIKAGVPAKAILIEEHSQNTRQNAENTDLLLKDHDIKSVILTTSGYHPRRR